jgi:ABC-2 type transport system permease protein
MARSDQAPASVIHDIGYQRYEGVRLGRGHGVRALYVASLRAAFGLGRSAKSKVLPFGILGLTCGIAVVLVVVRQVAGGELGVSYLNFPASIALLLVIFLAVVAPELVSPDLRNRTLSLYFSRPIHRVDYAVAKLAALITAVFGVLTAPLVIMFAGGALRGGIGLGDVWDEWQDFSPAVLNAAMYAIVLSALALLLASLTGRRAFAAGGIVAIFLVSTPVVAILAAIGTGPLQDLAGVFNPITLLGGAQKWIFGEGPEVGRFGAVYGLVALALAAGAAALFIQRYRKVTA